MLQGGEVEVIGRDAWLGGPLPVDDLAVGAVATELLAAAELVEARGGRRRPEVSLSAEHVALSFQSERHAQVGGAPAAPGFAPLSRFVRCADGWARTHGNYPHHAAALARALGFELGVDAPAALERSAAAIDAGALEDAVVGAGGCAAAVRAEHAWLAHPAGRAASELPLVDWDSDLATAPARSLEPCADPHQPAAGVRVLDLTRVLAGPIAGRSLAALGAEVLRIDPPHLPEIPAQHLDTGVGKRSAVLDLAQRDAREALLAGADVLLMGYRPGSLSRFDLDAEALARRHPHLVVVSLSAWGHKGPWAERRGFDSLVQAASGIALICGSPGALPAQALDHASGYLMATAALRGLSARARGELIAPARVALARTAAELLGAPRPGEQQTDATGRAGPGRYRVTFGDVVLIGPPGALDGVPLSWRHGPRAFGGDEARWLADTRRGAFR